jgi:tetratricopeptide (TPR) repeat protein
MLLALAAAGGLWRWHALSRPAAPALSAPGEDPEEIRLRRAAEARPHDAAARMALGQYYEQRARPFEAVWEFTEARHLAPSNPEVPLHLAAALQAGEAGSLATAPLRDARRARPDDLAARRALAELCLSMAQPDQARAALEGQRAALWQDLDSVLVLGRARHAAGDDAGAMAAFKQAISLEPRQARAWYELGRLYLGLGRLAEARDAFNHAITGDASRPEYRYHVGLTYLQEGGATNAGRAMVLFKEALSLQSNYAPAYYQQGVALERQGRRREALSDYSFSILADTSYPEPNLALGRGSAAVGDARDAGRYLGRYYDLIDRPDLAVREFQAMQRVERESVQPVLLMGQVLIRTGQSDRAVALTEAALKQHPDDAQLLERLAVLKINRGDRGYARRLLHHWLKLEPKAARPCWLLGRCDLGDLRYAEGVAWLEKAVARQPKNPHFLGFLGAGLMRMGTPESLARAAEVLGNAVQLGPEDAEYRDLYGQVLQGLGRYEEARRQFLRALNAEPYRVACYTPLLQIAHRLNCPGAAAFLPTVTRAVQQRVSEESLLWPHVWEHPEDADGHLKLARLLCRLGKLDKARNQLQQAVKTRSGWPEAQRLLATVRRCQEAL